MEPKAGVVEPKAGVDVEPKAGVDVEPKAGVEVAPKADAVAAPNAGWLVEPKRVFPNVGWLDAPKGLAWLAVDPNPPNADFPPNPVEEAPNPPEPPPNAGVADAPKAGAELPLPNGDADEAPNAGEEACPKTPVDVPPKIEFPAGDPNGLGLPNGFGANGFDAGCPNTDGEPNAPLVGCCCCCWPKGLLLPNMAAEGIGEGAGFGGGIYIYGVLVGKAMRQINALF